MQTRFFFDVADCDYIKDKWSKIKPYCSRDSVVGVTTNPGIWNKAGITDFDDMVKRLKELTRLVTDIREGDDGVVYVQPPYSRMSPDEIKKFIDIVIPCSDGYTKIGCKLPPYTNILSSMYLYDLGEVELNVTGISDCSTALLAASYDVRYISVIVGRMEEIGINAIDVVDYIRNSNSNGYTEIITGAMRTVDCLKWACQYGTIPTIGTRVWDKIIDEVKPENFTSLWIPQKSIGCFNFSPLVTQNAIDLSVGFFKQMDDLGASLYKSFKDKI